MVGRVLRELKIDLPHDQIIPLLGIYPNKIKSANEKVICIPIFIAAQFTKIWNKPKCLPADDWIKELWHINIYIYIKDKILCKRKSSETFFELRAIMEL